MKLGRAYEILKDESKRRAYDLIYPSIARSGSSAQTAQTPRPPPASTPRSEALSEAAQVAALQKLKQERGARWWTKRTAFDSSIFELQRDIRQLKQGIKNLDIIVTAAAAAEAQKNSWGTWLLSPIYKKAEDSEEDKARKDRARQERRIEKDLKERRLGLKQADLEKVENQLREAKQEVDAAELANDGKIRVIQGRIRAREIWERQERERVERERLAKIWKQQQEQREECEWAAAEALRKQLAEAEQKRQEEQARYWQKIVDDETKRAEQHDAHHNVPEHFFTAERSTRQASRSACRHDGWWPKVQGSTACPECRDVWNYLLQCPGCNMKACPKCQGAIRPRIPRNAARTNRRVPPRARALSPDFFYDPYD